LLYTANIATFAFHKVVRRRYSGDVSLQHSYVKVPRDYVQQKLLKSVNFWPSYSNIDRVY